MKYYLYKITSPSNKVYIGQTKNVRKRYLEYKRLDCVNQRIIFNSIKKYGWDNHKFEVLQEIEGNQEYIDSIEINHILLYKTLKLSMNITQGGQGTKGTCLPKGKNHYKSKIIYKYSLDGIFIKKYDCMSSACAENNVNIAALTKALRKNTYYSKGFLWISEEMFIKGIIPRRKDISEKKKMNPPKPVIQYSMDMEVLNEYSSLTEAASKNNLSWGHVGQCCRGNISHAGKFKWKYKN